MTVQKKELPHVIKARRGRPPQPVTPVEWALLSDEEAARPGAILINFILTAASDRGIGLSKIGQEALGVSPSYFHALRAGLRPVSGLGEEHIARAAQFLRMPVISVLLAAGRLKVEDFYAVPTTVEDFLLPALRRIQRDPEFGPLIPPDIFKADVAIQKCVVFLYEKATGEPLIPGRITPEAIVARHQSLIPSRVIKDNE